MNDFESNQNRDTDPRFDRNADHDTKRNASLGEIRIDGRFNGPPDSGNGGYVCGEMAKALGCLDSGARVRLRQPPPLETTLRIAATGDGCALHDGETLLGEAWPEHLELEVPDPVTIELASEAALAFRGFNEHVFPACFVCGPDRADGDGLRIFPGPLPAGATSIEGVFAAPWQPDTSLAEAESDFVDGSFIWAALDCPGCFSFPQPDGAIVLLGEMATAIPGRARVDEPSVLLSWQIEHVGRKHITGSAIYDSAGVCHGLARATWIEIPTG